MDGLINEEWYRIICDLHMMKRKWGRVEDVQSLWAEIRGENRSGRRAGESKRGSRLRGENKVASKRCQNAMLGSTRGVTDW